MHCLRGINSTLSPPLSCLPYLLHSCRAEHLIATSVLQVHHAISFLFLLLSFPSFDLHFFLFIYFSKLFFFFSLFPVVVWSETFGDFFT
ncbi:hypothetical protein HOY80DRAFT_367558 [Tuber brumale]|nr:hypothetical protein HOY80DRAFT_367558 [Tuber brumale]